MKVLRIFVGTVSGAIWAALLGASFLWVSAYTDSRSWYLGPIRNWAPAFALVGGLYGLGVGLALGLVLSLVNRGKWFGALLGTALGLIAIVWFGVVDGPPEWKMRSLIFLIALMPLGGLSGFLTSLSVATAVSWNTSRLAKRAQFQ